MQSYTHITLEERICLYEKLREGHSLNAISKILNRSVSTLSRELKRHGSTRESYNPHRAEDGYRNNRQTCRRKLKLFPDSELKSRIAKYLLHDNWSPEIISAYERQHHKIVIGISTIYRAIKGNLLEGITERKVLRRGGKRKYCRGGGQTIQPVHSIHDRDEIIERRERVGDWEGDTVLGAVGKGGLLTMVDRKSRYLIALIVQSKSSQEVGKAIIKALKDAPLHSVTLDNGAEFAKFKEIEKILNKPIYFADTHSPWQRGTNENLNGLLRWYYPKGYDFTKLKNKELKEVVERINNRPRKCLGWKTPKEIFHEVLHLT